MGNLVTGSLALALLAWGFCCCCLAPWVCSGLRGNSIRVTTGTGGRRRLDCPASTLGALVGIGGIVLVERVFSRTPLFPWASLGTNWAVPRSAQVQPPPPPPES